MLFDRRYPSFRNFDSITSSDVIRMKSYMDSLFDPSCVPVRVTINKLNFLPIRKMPRFVSVRRNCGGLRTSKPYISVVFFYSFLHRFPCFTDVYFGETEDKRTRQQRTNVLQIATRKQSTPLPDEDQQYCSRNVAINNSKRFHRETNE